MGSAPGDRVLLRRTIERLDEFEEDETLAKHLSGCVTQCLLEDMERIKECLEELGNDSLLRKKVGEYRRVIENCFAEGDYKGAAKEKSRLELELLELSLIHICRCRRPLTCRSRWSPYH
eukprot:TRINITY_DN18148_c0_g1_i1.p1 TRINITY_DN18148_c0_g1~~TRINITY_DN18148_c0_g1_i1.p1  ORF type:complete len:119 (+),score=30.05 TRINITY_DN18148_c0_g1_i1:90-446(+)